MKFTHVLALALSLQILGGAVAGAATFSDLRGHWSKNAVQELSQKGILQGYETGKFMPNRPLTRGEFATMLLKVVDHQAELGLLPQGVNKESFRDLNDANWATKNIREAGEKNLVQGYPDQHFKSSDFITRAEALNALAKITLGDQPMPDHADLILSKRFRDAKHVPQWAKAGVAKVADARIYVNQRSIRPESNVSRGEMAVMLDKLLAYNEKASRPYIQIAHKWEQVSENLPVEIKEHRLVPKTKPTFTTTVASALSSEYTRVGDKVTLILNEPLVSPTGEIAPSGSKILGVVSEVQPAGPDKEGVLKIRFDEVLTPANKSLKMAGTVGTPDGYLKGTDLQKAVVPQAGGSYEGMKAQAHAVIGATQRTLKNDVYSLTDAAGGNFADQKALGGNKKNFVLVGVGDRMEIRLDGATHHEDRI